MGAERSFSLSANRDSLTAPDESKSPSGSPFLRAPVEAGLRPSFCAATSRLFSLRASFSSRWMRSATRARAFSSSRMPLIVAVTSARDLVRAAVLAVTLNTAAPASVSTTSETPPWSSLPTASVSGAVRDRQS